MRLFPPTPTYNVYAKYWPGIGDINELIKAN